MTPRLALPLAVLLILCFSLPGFAQSLPDVSSVKDLPSTNRPSPKYQRIAPLSLHAPVFRTAKATSSITTGAFDLPFSTARIISVPTFDGSFISHSKTWHFTMMGSSPWASNATSIPTHIAAVSLKLQNANLVSFTTVPVGSFVAPTLQSPNFQNSNYSTGSGIQFADAVQRAEFFHKMAPGWHTVLRPVSVVQNLTMTVPRFTTVNVNGTTMKVQTYFTSKSGDGRVVVFMLDQFFNQQISNIVVNEINAGGFTTGALNVALFPNTYLFSVNSSGGVGNCCVLGFHTYFTNLAPVESRWIFAFASWISPGVFSGFEDVTALSHEISEAINDPFVNNLVPAWQFPTEPGTCQDNLETGDPVEVLTGPMFPVTIFGTTFHPQTEALLQWFEQKPTSTAINSAFSYPNTKTLVRGATAFGPLACP